MFCNTIQKLFIFRELEAYAAPGMFPHPGTSCCFLGAAREAWASLSEHADSVLT